MAVASRCIPVCIPVWARLTGVPPSDPYRQCHTEFIPRLLGVTLNSFPLPLKSVSLTEREGLWEHKLADGMEVPRVPFIQVWYDTNGIIAGWARVEPDQCEMTITG